MTKPACLLLPLFLSLAFAAPAQAQDSLAQFATPPQRTSILVTFGDEPCPDAEDGEIVVCANKPESDRYRVPKELRGADDEASGGGGSWASRVEAYDDIARTGRPNSCSPVGSFGFTGCTAAMLRHWFAERPSR